MNQADLVVRGRRVVIPEKIGPASVLIKAGKIIAVSGFDDYPAGAERIDAAEDSVVMPGLVDTHVHVNEPGRAEWEGFETATRAAAAGGVTTIVDMPLNSIPATTTVEGLRAKLSAATKNLHVDVGFWGGVVPGNTDELAKLWDAGVLGFKCFLIDSGVKEFPSVGESDLRQAMPELARLGAILIVHAELPGPVEAATASADRQINPSVYETFLSSRPREAENRAVDLMIRLNRETNCRVHIVHHSSADALTLVQAAKRSGVDLTVETCPHYLHFAAEDIPDGATEFKCCPPIREHQNREQLWQALRQGIIDMVVSDHSPSPPEMKLRQEGDFMNAWGGISSLQFRLPVMHTEALNRGCSIEELTEWLCAAPARLVGLRQKGLIAVDHDADLVIWNPTKEFRIAPENIHHRHKLTPYAGEIFRGKIEKTLVRGQIVYDDGDFGSQTHGNVILRGVN